jgi:hypothetical protein
MTNQLFAPSLKATIAGESRPHIEAVRQSLRRHVGHLSAADHDRIVNGLMQDGLARDAGHVYAGAETLSPLQAARDPRRHPILVQLKRELRRFDYELDLNDSSKLDVPALDRALRASGASLSDRIEIKTQLAQCGLID